MQRLSSENITGCITAIITALMFILCGPLCTVLLLFASTRSHDICSVSEKALVAVAWGKFVLLLDSAVNPIIFYFGMHDLRNAIKRIFERKEKISVEDSKNDNETP